MVDYEPIVWIISGVVMLLVFSAIFYIASGGHLPTPEIYTTVMGGY